MKNIIAEIDIEASPQAVWDVLTDFEQYPAWNPFIIEMPGPLRLGVPIREKVRLPNGKEVTFSTRIVSLEAPHRLVWHGYFGLPSLLYGEHSFLLAPLAQGAHTRLTQAETFTGLISPLMDVELSLKGYHLMNQALKVRVESV